MRFSPGGKRLGTALATALTAHALKMKSEAAPAAEGGPRNDRQRQPRATGQSALVGAGC